MSRPTLRPNTMPPRSVPAALPADLNVFACYIDRANTAAQARIAAWDPAPVTVWRHGPQPGGQS